jgi:lipopolysaccharide/colanic/teichoic acid biosynthesis glycosyltransferase
MQLDACGRVAALNTREGGVETLCDTGAYIFEPLVLEKIPSAVVYDCYSQLVPALLAEGARVFGYVAQEYWNPLETAAQLHEAQRVFMYSAYQPTAGGAARPELPRVRYPSIEGHQIAPGVWVAPNHIIHPRARIAPPICIGEGCQIGADVELGPETVIGPNVVVDDEATVQHSIIMPGTYVGRLVNIERRVVDQTSIIDIQTSERTEVVDPFLLARLGPAPTSRAIPRLLSSLMALALLLLCLPLLLLLAVIVFLTCGRVLARSQRIGGWRRPGDLAASPEPEQFALLGLETRRADGTTSLVGAWLHRLELDRLPELWNVLVGDLALIGVKPLLPAEAAHIREGWHQKHFECRPGFTGLWYVQTNHDSDLDDILIADAYFVALRTWRSDLALLWQTPHAWLCRIRASRPAHTAQPEQQAKVRDEDSRFQPL